MNICPFHSVGKPIFTTTYNISDSKFYVESESYFKHQLLNYIKREISPYIQFNSNSTWQRFIIEIIKNDRSSSMDTYKYEIAITRN